MKDLRGLFVMLFVIVAFGGAMMFMMTHKNLPIAADASKPLSQLPAQGAPPQ